jgi:hypothetical protein
MNIHGLTVCVDYADFLQLGIGRWLDGLESLTIVTTPEDLATHQLADVSQLHGTEVRVHETHVFYANGAAFNKGGAMEEARRRTVPPYGWLLLFDADVVPPKGWRETVAEHAEWGCFHGARRVDALTKERFQGDAPGMGYFQLFHTGDAPAQRRPLITSWVHAGNYDNELRDQWAPAQRRVLPLTLEHHGPRDNWFGRGQAAAFEAMQAERRARGGSWAHERLP